MTDCDEHTEQPTRTELGHALWKESPRIVKEARDLAKLRIAQGNLSRTISEPLHELVGRLDAFFARWFPR